MRARGGGRKQPLYASTKACASALQVHPQTVRAYLKAGLLRGVQLQVKLRWYDAERKTQRGRWLIEVASIEELLVRLYNGADVPPSIRRRLKSLGKPLPTDSP